MLPATLALNEAGTAKKGDVLGIARIARIARIAGIMAAKKTSDLIPLCHPLALTRVAIEFEAASARQTGATGIFCVATVETVGPTGVEMEALTAVQVALLTIYVMCKAVERGMSIHDVRVVEKHGGKSGSFVAGAAGRAAADTTPLRPGTKRYQKESRGRKPRGSAVWASNSMVHAIFLPNKGR